ncbi:hypothetical protein OMAG_000335 [Candidatus Omnitrophus magneticus]|uniref:Uncharacterized protein n=1 Tax=Candidatus Omnitrophus magneticus TaxID=1609969 RepID=A0A0F0CW49_9BACT|nr:hypothetical protein OMAG_000335 [Candidatus Omnitrophus magneticus]
MNNSQNYDHIDTELAKLYFRNRPPLSGEKNIPEKIIPPESEKETREPKQIKTEETKKENKTSKKDAYTFSSKGLTLYTATIIAVTAFLTLTANEFFAWKMPIKNIHLTSVRAEKNLSKKTHDSSQKKAPSTKISNEKTLVKKSSAETPVTKNSNATPPIIYNFNYGTDGWEIPSWEFDKDDHVAKTLKPVKDMPSVGKNSLELTADFQKDKWSCALIEISHYLNLSEYSQISGAIYLPYDSPKGLRAKFILTAGRNWNFIEMSHSMALVPGQWTNIKAGLLPTDSDWKNYKMRKTLKSDIRKIAIRIESNQTTSYAGPIYIDNIKITQ